MISKINKNAERKRRHVRVRRKISGTAETPRFNVYRSLNHIYVQVIDDVKGVTLCSASTMEKEVKAEIKDMTKTEAAKVVGKKAAERAIAAGVKQVVFDRGGYLYTGRVQARVMEEKKERTQRRDSRPRRRDEDDGFIKKLIQVNRVSKTVKGGRNMRFAALVVVGDGKGSVGYGMGKSKEVPEAIEKATAQAKRSLIKCNLKDTSIPHTVKGVYGRGAVLMMPATQGTGVIAGGPVRAVMEAAGIKDIRTKSHGTNNPINCVKAAVAGLAALRSPEDVAAARGKSVEEILG